MTPNPEPDDIPETPVFPPPGEDGDRDAENPDIETPVPVNAPDWQDLKQHFENEKIAMTPEEFRRLYEGEWRNEIRHYHSHLCECPICAEAGQQRQSRIKDFMRIASQW